MLLMKEIVYVSKIMKKTFKAFNLNVEKIGNIVSQLHIHVIARSKIVDNSLDRELKKRITQLKKERK